MVYGGKRVLFVPRPPLPKSIWQDHNPALVGLDTVSHLDSGKGPLSHIKRIGIPSVHVAPGRRILGGTDLSQATSVPS